MRRLSLLLAHLAVIAALAVSTGAHWIVLQSVAWTSMFIDFSHDASLVVAVEKTFDGKHPCSLCLTIEGAEKQQHEPQTAQPLPAIKGVIAPLLCVSAPVGIPFSYPPIAESAERLSQSPPLPPPRRAAA